MNRLLLFLSFLVSVSVNAQQTIEKNIYCSGLETLPLKLKLVINGRVQKEYISKTDFTKYDLYLVLSDTTYKIDGFKASFDCHSGYLFDINEKTYYGNKILRQDPFLLRTWVGDSFYFDCVTVTKNGKKYLVRGIYFHIE